MVFPVAAIVPTVEANPKTMAGGKESSGTEEARIIAAVPTPTQMAAKMGCAGPKWMVKSVREAMTMPVALDATDLTKPCCPPPQAKNDAQAMNVTQTGRGTIVAVM
jgi:hypothetical protein